MLLEDEKDFLGDPLDRPLPAGMDGGHDPALRIVHQDRYAIRGVDADRAAGYGGHQRIVATQLLLAHPGTIHDRHAEAVDLVGLHDRVREDGVASRGESLDAGAQIIAQKCLRGGHSESKYTFFSITSTPGIFPGYYSQKSLPGGLFSPAIQT